MTITKTRIADLLIIEPKVFQDDRGYFMKSFKNTLIEQYPPKIHFIQNNESKSTCRVLRGIHFQEPPFARTKSVRVIEGEILDCAVDLRTNSSSYGKYFSILLSGYYKNKFVIPKGFGNGFVVLNKNAIFSYKVDNEYHPEFDSGIRFDYRDLGIDWNLKHLDIVLSKKDLELQNFKNFVSPF